MPSVFPSQMLGSSLRLIRELGRGGMGSVWEAEHLTLRRTVAVKFLSSELAGNAQALARFRREAMTVAQIKSSHVVQVYDHGVTETGAPYIVMELLEGRDVGNRIQALGALPLDAVEKMVLQVSRALDKAHAKGLVHRDIKPDNIFIVESDEEPLYKVLDFGIAKVADDTLPAMTATQGAIGTPYYMSPEQLLSSGGVDARTDLWSLAVVAYEALTAVRPFEADTMGALCVAIDRCKFTPPSTLVPGLPVTLDHWFLRALARDRDQRHQSARELASTFSNAIRPARSSASSWDDVSIARRPSPSVDATLIDEPSVEGTVVGVPAFDALTFNTGNVGASSRRDVPSNPQALIPPTPRAPTPPAILVSSIADPGLPRERSHARLVGIVAGLAGVAIFGGIGLAMLRSTHNDEQPSLASRASEPSASPTTAPVPDAAASNVPQVTPVTPAPVVAIDSLPGSPAAASARTGTGAAPGGAAQRARGGAAPPTPPPAAPATVPAKPGGKKDEYGF